MTFAPAGPGGVTWTPASLTLIVTGGPSSGAIQTGGASATGGVTNAAFGAAFNVNVSSAVTQGTVATSSGAVQVQYTYTPPPALNLTCPASTGTVGVPYNGALVATGGVPGYTYSITVGVLPPLLVLNANGTITGTPTTAGPFNFTAQVVDSVGGVAGTATAQCTITISDIPQGSGDCTAGAAAAVIFPPGGGQPGNSFLVRYAANLNLADSVINMTNTGVHGASLFGPGFGGKVGTICANVYTFSPDEQLVSCCTCPITPNGLQSLSVYNDLTSNTLTGVRPNSVVIKLVASLPGANVLAGGLAAWGTTTHPFTTTVAGGLPAAEVGLLYGVETPFRPATLSAQELASITNRCTNIIGNGSTFGICRACRNGGLGAVKQ